MSYSYQLIVLIVLALGLTACGGSNSDNGAGQGGNTNAVLSGEAVYGKELRKKGCELLTAELVGNTFDIPAENLRQMKVAGCRYDWSNDSEVVEASISMIMAHNSEAAAAGWFASATKSRTAEEMQAEMGKIAEQIDKRESLDTKAKKSAAAGLLGSISAKAVNFEDIPGIGEEARVSDDGTVYVRVDNLTFMVSAYKGPVAPPLDLRGVDLKQMAKLAQESSAEWASKTAPQRKQDSAKLASAIVVGL